MQLTTQEERLFARARERITSGFLPRTVPASVGAGWGSGETCRLCDSAIEPKQVEYELAQHGSATFRFHMRCHAIWHLAADDMG
jgi:hypothetical protein